MEDPDYEAFSEIDWDKASYLVDGKVTDVHPNVCVTEDDVLVRYFEDIDSYSDLDEEMQDLVDRMSADREEVMNLLLSEPGIRTVSALLGEDSYVERPDLWRFTDYDPVEQLETMSEMGLIETDESGKRTGYRIDINSDAYWLLQIDNASHEYTPGRNNLERLKNNEVGNDLVQLIGRKDYYKSNDES